MCGRAFLIILHTNLNFSIYSKYSKLFAISFCTRNAQRNLKHCSNCLKITKNITEIIRVEIYEIINKEM